ncbi:MAG: hypothetical protein DRP83_07550, partial [Planctomycetota bacterium]
MIYWLFETYFSHGGLGLRIGAAGAFCFLFVLLLGPRTIRFLYKKRIGDNPQFNHPKLNEMRRH